MNATWIFLIHVLAFGNSKGKNNIINLINFVLWSQIFAIFAILSVKGVCMDVLYLCYVLSQNYSCPQAT